MAVDRLRHLVALHLAPAKVDDRSQMERLATAAQDATGANVTLVYADQGYIGKPAAEAAEAQGMELCVVKLPEAKRGFVLLPKRWAVERWFAWATRFRRLAKDYERYVETLAGFHVVAFICITLAKVAAVMQGA